MVACPAGRGGGFPNPHIQVVQINTAKWPTLSVNRQCDMEPAFLLRLSSLTTGNAGRRYALLGWQNSVCYQRGSVADAATGVVDSTVWYARLSTACMNRWGDYLAVSRKPDTTPMRLRISVLNTTFSRQYVVVGSEAYVDQTVAILSMNLLKFSIDCGVFVG